MTGIQLVEATKKSREEAEERTRKDLKTVYDAHLLLAERYINGLQEKRAEQWLSTWLPENAVVDVRDAAWRNAWDRLIVKAGYVGTLKGHTNDVNCVSFSPDGKRLLSGSGDQTAKVWDAVTGQEVHTFVGLPGNVGSVAWSPTGKRIVVSCADKLARVWDVDTEREVCTLKGHTLEVHSVSFSADGKRIASGSKDQTVTLVFLKSSA